MSSQNENSTNQESTTVGLQISTKPNPPVSTHNMVGKYVALMETNDKECESWYYFIKYDGNENNLKSLQDQLEKVDWHIMEDLSTFDLDLEHYVSAQTAKEMSKLELNAHSFHRKFDGILQKIDLEFKKKDSDETMICKTFDQLGYGQIEDFIDDEDLDEEDLTDNEDRSSDEDESSDESSDDNSSSDESSSSSSEDERKNTRGSIHPIPPTLLKTNTKSKKKKLQKKKRY